MAKHTSVPMDFPCEFIEMRAINPLISECVIKVCYVDDEKPNRNGSLITKAVAEEMAQTLPGSPIVGHFSKPDGDFEEHNRVIKMSGGNWEIEEDTRPYGFVPTDAKCWFKKYKDDNFHEREYLCTQGYLWTGQYPDCKRIIEQGNNQSMELDDDLTTGDWSYSENSGMSFFIINEAVISKLCVLGEEHEPCFEGSTITAPTQYAIMNKFKSQLYSLVDNINKYIEGGKKMELNFSNVSEAEITAEVKEQVFAAIAADFTPVAILSDANSVNFALVKNEENKYFACGYSIENDAVTVEAGIELEENVYSAFVAAPVVEEPEATEPEAEPVVEDEGKNEQTNSSETEKDIEENPVVEEPVATVEEPVAEPAPAAVAYVLEEIPEYVEALATISTLQNSLSEKEATITSLNGELETLREFKLAKDREEKKALINSFYMLTDEDKKNVIDNIDTYSLKEIKAELSIMCFDNKVSFAREEDNSANRYNLNYSNMNDDEDIPEWVKAVCKTQGIM